jgi:hypothetical protein
MKATECEIKNPLRSKLLLETLFRHGEYLKQYKEKYGTVYYVVDIGTRNPEP